MAEVGRTGHPAPRGGLVRQLAHNLILAASKLPEPYFGLYDRLYLQGANESEVCEAMRYSRQEFEQKKAEMLRMIHCATTT